MVDDQFPNLQLLEKRLEELATEIVRLRSRARTEESAVLSDEVRDSVANRIKNLLKMLDEI